MPTQAKASVHSTDTETVPLATTDEMARADLITYNNDSTGSPHPVLDVRPNKVNLQPKSAMRKIGSGCSRPKFNRAKFFNENNFFIGESPYDSAKIRRVRFWKTH